MRIRFTCMSSTKRFLSQTDPATKAPIRAHVHDAEFQVTPGHEDNKAAFIGSHGGLFKLVAVSEPFDAGQDYYLDVTRIDG